MNITDRALELISKACFNLENLRIGENKHLTEEGKENILSLIGILKNVKKMFKLKVLIPDSERIRELLYSRRK